jgi:hypothetical protein
LASASTGNPAVESSEKHEAAEEALEEFIDYTDKYELSAKNIFKAHKQAIGNFLFVVSWPTLPLTITSHRLCRGWTTQLL